MASAFKLFGEIDVKTQAFQGALRDLDSRLQGTAKNISDTESRAKSLGATSATAARGFEKLDVKITDARTELDALTKAYDRGDISAKKYAAGLASVERAAVGAASRVKDINARLTDLGPKDAPFVKDLVAQLQTVRGGLRDTFGGQSVGANLAATKARELYTELKNIQAAAASTTRPQSLKVLGDEARRVQGEIDALEAKITRVTQARQATAQRSALTGEQKYGRINLARQAADVFTQAGSGASAQIIAIQQGPQILEALAQSGFKASSAIAGISTAFLAVGSVAAVAGAIAIDITKQIKERAEKARDAEFHLQGAINKGIIAQKEALALAIKTREEAEKTRRFNAEIAESDPDSLRRKRENLLQRQAISNPEQIKQFEQQITAIDQQLFDLEQKRISDERSAFDQRFENFKKFQEDTVKAEIEAAKKAAEEREKALEESLKKLDEMQKNALSAVDAIASRNTNPFVRVFNEAQKALETLKENTKGFAGSIVASLTAAVQQANALALAAARLDAGQAAIEAGFGAQRFRGETEKDANKRINRQLRELARSSNSTNPDVLLGLMRQAEAAGNKALFESAASGLLANTTNPDVLNDVQNRLENFKSFDEIQKKREADTQLDFLLNKSRGTDSEQVALIDKRIQALGQQFGPDTFDPSKREAIAQAFEREQGRQARLETDAVKFYNGEMQWQKEIVDFVQKQKESAKNSKDGKLQIEITDKDGRVNGVKTPTPEDVKITYGTYGTAGGLSSF